MNETRNLAGQMSIVGIVLLIFCVVILGLMAWFLSLPPDCDPDCKKEIVGVLSGFEKNGSKWNVMLDNKTLIFDYFDKNYMQGFISKNVTILACERRIDHRLIYSMLSCFITNVKEND